MRNLKNNKAAGTDGIHLMLIKYRGNKLLNRNYGLVRQIWEEERIPAEWKETVIVPIYKKEAEIGVKITGENNIRKHSLQNFGKHKFGKKKLNHILIKLPGTIRMDSEIEEL